MKTTLRKCVVVVSIVLWTAAARADIVLPDLPNGSPFQLLFVTQGKTLPTSGDLNFYHNFVADQAALNPALPNTSWKAVISTQDSAARNNAP